MDKNILNSFLFHPRKSLQLITEKDFLINIEDGICVGSRLHLIKLDAPTILFFHGNAEIVTDYDDIAQIYNQRGINFIINDYRGYGYSSGKPDSKNILSDSHIVFTDIRDKLRDQKFIGPLVIMGRSLGSTCALELAQHFPEAIAGLIIESGFADEGPLFQLFGIRPEQVGFKKEDGFLNGEKIAKYEGPLLVIHAEKDHIVPFSEGELLYNCCPSEKKKFIPIPNANHNNILGASPQKYFEEVTQFIKNCTSKG